MSQHANQPKKLFQGLFKQGFLLKLALLRHQKSPEPRDARMENLIRINEELEAVHSQVCNSYPGSVEEANALARIRELEDMRFQLLSQINGNHLEAYNSLSPQYLTGQQ